MILFAFLGLGFIGQRYLHDYANDLANDRARKDAPPEVAAGAIAEGTST